MSAEKLIKVGLPGESLWAEVVGKTDNGRTKAKLRNASLHGATWGTEVVLGADGYTVVYPRALVDKAQRTVDSIRGSAKRGDP